MYGVLMDGAIIGLYINKNRYFGLELWKEDSEQGD